jgi:pimeloyl-ACP methyl ester carboxylesterase
LRQRIDSDLPETGAFYLRSDRRICIMWKLAPTKNQTIDQALFLLHGSSGSSFDMMATLGGKLASQFHVLSFDRPGIANSCNRISNHDMSDPRRQAGAIYAAADALGLKNPIVIGHSWGGSVATGLCHAIWGRTYRSAGAGGSALSLAGAGQLV